MAQRILSGLLLLSITVQAGASAPDCCKCLPVEISGADVVAVLPGKVGDKETRTLSVNQKLRQLKAHCKRGKLVDGSGRQIYFFPMTGCWGNPPENYQEILDEQARKLAQLRKRYTVIEMTCNPSGMLIP